MKLIRFSLLILSICFATDIFAQKSLPSVEVKTLDGKSVNIQEFGKKGKITVVSFWATWCAPCKKELDAIADSYEEWQKNYDVEVIAVTIDDARAVAKVKPMVAQKGWKYTILSDVNQDLQRALNFPSVPQSYLLDQKGNIVYSHSGYVAGDEDELEEKIKALVKK
jgi:cytochrome c biogenesis protein CcmG, thiol:disulfide interchange protein DsbE